MIKSKREDLKVGMAFSRRDFPVDRFSILR